jgi:uncharacterized repeat protein (TIGR02543 family)
MIMNNDNNKQRGVFMNSKLNKLSACAIAVAFAGLFSIAAAQGPLTVDVTPIGGGKVVRDLNLAAYPQGTTVNLTAEPKPGYVFKRWTGAASGTASTIRIVTAGHTKVTAVFEKIQYESISVSNTREFLEALGSNRIVELKAGRYNLSEYTPHTDNDVSLSEGVSWSRGDAGTLDGIDFNNIHNLTIRGARSGVSEIVIDSRVHLVMRFFNSSNIAIENITAGHTESTDECRYGVLYFRESSQIAITGTKLYGSGFEGLEFIDASNVKVTNSQIYECTQLIMSISRGSNISFENCLFRDNAGYALIDETKNVTFKNCEFRNNEGAFHVGRTTVTVSRTTFRNNGTREQIVNSPNVKFDNCVFE